jgi:hypothetical protein
VDVRIARLKRYETWRKARKIDFASIVGQQRWKEFWELCENITEQLKKDQQIANEIRADIAKAVAGGERTAR